MSATRSSSRSERAGAGARRAGTRRRIVLLGRGGGAEHREDREGGGRALTGLSSQEGMYRHANGPWSMVITRSWVVAGRRCCCAGGSARQASPRLRCGSCSSISSCRAGAREISRRWREEAVYTVGTLSRATVSRPGMRLFATKSCGARSRSHRRRQRDPTAAVRRDWMPESAAGTSARPIMSSQVQPTNRPSSATCMRECARNAAID